jgi:hypothetical protein
VVLIYSTNEQCPDRHLSPEVAGKFDLGAASADGHVE